MYGAFIGDVVGSKYEFHNIKTMEFPLFSKGCDFTDDSVMTAAVAAAIVRSREAQYHNTGNRFSHILVETMQDFGKRYPNPTGAYGTRFNAWLRADKPEPYNSFGNGSAMRVSPCGLIAVDLWEAIALARVSAAVSHNHPEGIKGAEAVAAAIFLAKTGRSKEEIRRYIEEHYYQLNLTLDEIRPSYRFDETCQGSVSQAMVAFLESENFEDAIRNAISLGGDSDTLGAITGSIAWTFYSVQSGGYSGWVDNKIDPRMLDIKEQVKQLLPQEYVDLAEDFHEACWRRAGTYDRSGFCTPILSKSEMTEL